MKSFAELLFFHFAFIVMEIHGQIVSNVTAEQAGNNLIISYSLEADTPCEVTFMVSTDGGQTWENLNKGVSGDVGYNISLGNHSIHWNVLEGQEQLVSSNVKFKVTARAIESFEIVKIGNQIWMAENLNVDRFRNGDVIPEARTAEEWTRAGENQKPVWCHYDNNPENGRHFGKLYNWYAVNDSRGLSPIGWHVPTNAEWGILTSYLGGEAIAGGKMKLRRKRKNETDLWQAPNQSVNNDSGFSGAPGGIRSDTGVYSKIGVYGYWWSSSVTNSTYAWFRYLYNASTSVFVYNGSKEYGYSVRCLRD